MPTSFPLPLVAAALLFIGNPASDNLATSQQPAAAQKAAPKLCFAPYTQQQFARLPHTAVDIIEKHHLLAAKGQVIRQKGQLIIRLPYQKTVRLTNNFSDTDVDNYAEYHFQGSIPELQSWAVGVGLWESGCTLLVNQLTGKQTRLWDTPVMAPDKKHFLTSRIDYMFEDDNGLQYWAVRDHAPVKLWEQQTTDWSPAEVRWIDNASVAIKQQRLADDGSKRYTYVSAKLTP